MTTHRDFMETWFRRVWADQDASAIDELMAEDCPIGLRNQTIVDRAAFKAFHQALLSHMSKIELTVDKSVEDGPWFSAICTVHATARASGQDFTFTGQVFGRIEDGLIREGYNHFDFIAMFEHLDLMPAGSFETALSGQRIA